MAWVLTIPLAASIAYGMYWLTQLPIVLAWVVVGTIVIGFSIWVSWAMRNSPHAADIEAEIPTEQALDEFDQDPTPHLKGRGPVS
jgi:heme/copper-type cytochrome/quinol oxidase subunit 2